MNQRQAIAIAQLLEEFAGRLRKLAESPVFADPPPQPSPAAPPPPAAEDRHIRLPEVLKRVGVSRSAWYKGVRGGIYPEPIKFGTKLAVWRESEINSLVSDDSTESLDTIKRDTLTTREAAYHLNRSEQTLRMWAMRESGPIQPIRVKGRLAWRVKDIRGVLQKRA